MKWVGSVMDSCILDWVSHNITKGSRVLELGSGDGSTQYLCKDYRLTSVENDAEWLSKYDSEYVFAPIKSYTEIPLEFEHDQGWYDHRVIEREIANRSFDLIIVDGPSREIGRGGFYCYFHLFDWSSHIIIGDTHRPNEAGLAEMIAEMTGRQKIKHDTFTIIPNHNKVQNAQHHP